MLKKIRNYFFTGLVIFIPLASTLWVILITFNFLEGILKPITGRFIGVPGISFLVLVLLITLVGMLGTVAWGKRAVGILESGLLRIPFVGGVYKTVKEASDTILTKRPKDFKSIVLVEFPKAGSYAIGFTTASNMSEVSDKVGREVINVYVPTTPNPTSGFLIMVPKDEAVYLDMSAEEAFKLILSGGLSQKKNSEP
jgi:uncharacterized membrane protein